MNVSYRQSLHRHEKHGKVTVEDPNHQPPVDKSSFPPYYNLLFLFGVVYRVF